MARSSAIIYGLVLVVGSLTAAQSQVVHRVPRPRPPVNQQGQPYQPGQPYQSGQPYPVPQAYEPLMQPTPPVNAQPTPAVTPNPAQQPNPQQTAPRPPDPPPTTPPEPPTVTYRDGLLTVQAMNSTLGSVIAAIRSKTGIEFDGAENVPDRVALSLGPAPAGEVLSAIFSGSKFDFMAIGRRDSPGIVQRVILSHKSQPGAVAGAQAQAPMNNGGDEEEAPDEAVNSDPQDTPVQPVPVPQMQPQSQNEPPQGQQQKTQEQLLQELIQLNEQRRQKGSPEDQSAPPPRKPPR